jgi:extensin-like protein
MPRERPVPGDRSLTPETDVGPSPCQLRLAELAVFAPSPPITGPGECVATDVVKVEAVLLPDKLRVAFSQPATLRCPMAEAVAQWITNDVAPAIAALGTPLRSIESIDSFDCRPRNGITGAQLSEHGRANALDVRSFKLANGVVIGLNDASVAKSLRERLRDSACARFSTVLGNGADAYHDTHVHIDLMERGNHYMICQWDVLDPAETAALAAKKAAAAAARVAAKTRDANDVLRHPVVDADAASLPQHGASRTAKERAMRTPVVLSLAASLTTSALAYAEEQTVTVGPWTIATSYKGDKFDNCSMSRSTAGLDVTFLRARDGLLLVLDSQKWKLDRGKAYAVRLVAGSRSVEAKALAEFKAVTIALGDRALNEGLRAADVLEVRGEGATLRVPLDGSRAALGRLETCFDKSNAAGIDTNPFVAPSRKP